MQKQYGVYHMIKLQNSMITSDPMSESVNIAGHLDERDGESTDAAKKAVSTFEGEFEFEPCDGIEFESHEEAYSFYQEYAKSMGFTTSIKNSRRSKKSKEFIDAKFACSRYGVTPESDSGNSRRSSMKKTDCKASMHVKRRPDGKWIIYNFVKEHNHELLPALAYHFRIHRNVKLAEKNNIDILHAVSERTRKMYVEMSKQSGGNLNLRFLHSNISSQFEKGRSLSLEEGDAQVLLEYFKRIKKENPDFFYAIDLNEEQCLRNLFWVDAKSRTDYKSFNDVVSFDTFYVKYHEKLPFAPFVGVNNHCQPILLGCAFISDESKSTFVWLMKTWLRTMGGHPPKVIITDVDRPLKAAIEEVFPTSRHCFSLWHILEKIPENLSHVIKRHEHFLSKFTKCIFRSWTDEQFDMRWWKMVTRFELQNEWIQSLYEDRKKWVPMYMGDAFLAGISVTQRSESVNSFFDKYIHRKISMKEFMKQYGMILQNRYEEEAVADFDTLHKQPALKSPSPWEKEMSMIYTHAIFKKFQVEVLGVIGCHPRKESDDGTIATFEVQDCEKDENYLVLWNPIKSEVTCFCRLFEYNGFLCRHALIVLQICGHSNIPPRYILRRWTKDAKSREQMAEGGERVQTRVQRYNELCKLAIELSEEGSVSEDNYNMACRTLMDALKNCVDLNNSGSCSNESGGHILALHVADEESQGIPAPKSSKKKNPVRKRKVQSDLDVMLAEEHDSLQQMVQLNLMEPPHDGYYVDQQNIHDLGQLNPIASAHDSFFGTQQSLHGMGQFDFRPPTSFSYNLQDDSHLRSHFHGNVSRQT